MEEAIKLAAEKRQNTGTKTSVGLRSSGKLPLVLYGHGQSTESLAVDMHDFVEAVHHGHRIMELEIDGKAEQTMIKELQYDHLGRDIIHADMVRVNLSERVEVSVPVILKGQAKGTEQGGILEEHSDGVEIECRVSDIPESLELRIEELDIGESLYARDVKLPSGMKLVSDEDLLIVTCRVVTAEVEAEEEEALEEPSAPEVIGKESEEEQREQE